MPEFTLKLDPSIFVESFHEKIESSNVDVISTKLVRRDGWDYLTAEVRTIQITIYLGLVSLIAVSFAVFYWGASLWLYTLPAFLLSITLLGSSYYWILVFWFRLRMMGYRGRIKVAHAEGVF